MRCSPVHVFIKSAQWVGLSVMLVALPVSLLASPVIVSSTFTLGGSPGTITATLDPTFAIPDATGLFVDATHGLTEFDVTYQSVDYTMTEALDYSTLPEVFLPGNTLVPGGGYGFLGAWLVSGDIGAGTGTVLGVGNNVQAFLAGGVSVFTANEVAVNGSQYDTLVLGIRDTSFLKSTPEPALFPLLGLGIAGLWFVRRKAIR